MNFYTLTFKKKIYISLFLVLAMIVFLDLILVYIAHNKTSNDTYIHDKFSKIKHFELNNQINKDIIFIGSSKTFYHISTNAFKSKNINVFNLGVPGAEFEDYPSIVKSITKSQIPSKVIISLTVPRLYEDFKTLKSPTTEELSYFFEIDKLMFIDTLKKYLINYHTFLIYSGSIYRKLIAVYDKFYFSSYHTNYIHKDNTKLLSYSNNDYSKIVGCNVFDAKKLSAKRIDLKCSNGDGVLVGSDIRIETNKENNNLENLNTNTIRYLQKMIRKLIKNNIDVTLILEPIHDNQYNYDLSLIKQTFNDIKVLDLTDYYVSREKWADISHFNYLGREQYSEYLIKLYLQNEL